MKHTLILEPGKGITNQDALTWIQKWGSRIEDPSRGRRNTWSEFLIEISHSVGFPSSPAAATKRWSAMCVSTFKGITFNTLVAIYHHILEQLFTKIHNFWVHKSYLRGHLPFLWQFPPVFLWMLPFHSSNWKVFMRKSNQKIPSEMGVAPPHKRFSQFSTLIKL